MQGLQIRNDQVLLRVFRDARLDAQPVGDEQPRAVLDIEAGSFKVEGAEPITGLLYYAVPCVFEKLVVRVEGASSPVIQCTAGEWPTAVDDDDLEFYSHLHFLEERKTGTPWKWERWYTLAGPYLVFESEQYFERSCPGRRGKDWERLIVQLRQIMDLVKWCEEPDKIGINLICASGG